MFKLSQCWYYMLIIWKRVRFQRVEMVQFDQVVFQSPGPAAVANDLETCHWEKWIGSVKRSGLTF